MFDQLKEFDEQKKEKKDMFYSYPQFIRDNNVYVDIVYSNKNSSKATLSSVYKFFLKGEKIVEQLLPSLEINQGIDDSSNVVKSTKNLSIPEQGDHKNPSSE